MVWHIEEEEERLKAIWWLLLAENEMDKCKDTHQLNKRVSKSKIESAYTSLEHTISLYHHEVKLSKDSEIAERKTEEVLKAMN